MYLYFVGLCDISKLKLSLICEKFWWENVIRSPYFFQDVSREQIQNIRGFINFDILEGRKIELITNV